MIGDLTAAARALLERAARRSDVAEVYAVDADKTVVAFRGGEPVELSTSATRGFGLRVIHDGQVGFASGTGMDTGCGSRDTGHGSVLTEAALETARFGKPARFELPRAVLPAPVASFDNRVMMLTTRKVVEWGRDLVDAAHARVPSLKLDLLFRRVQREVSIQNTAGLSAGFARTEFSLTVTGLSVQDGLAWTVEYENLSDGRTLDVGRLTDRLEVRARQARHVCAVGRGLCPVVMMPMAMQALAQPLTEAVSGRELQQGTSPLAGRVGDEVLDEKLTIVDNPLRDHGLQSSPVDGEGVARRRNVLFERGVFRGFLFDLDTAAAAGAASTGSARRGYAELPAPGVTNIEVEPGGAKLEEVIAGIDEGLVVYDCIGAGQSNLLAGEVALNVVSGYRVEGGRVAGRVKDVSLAGNVYEMFRSVEAIGDRQEDLGDAFLPFVVFSGLRVEPGV